MKLIYVFLLVISMTIMLATNSFCAELVAAYSFDDGSAKKAKDNTGNGHDGEIKEAKVVDGKYGKALEFDGTNSQVAIPHDEKMNFKDAVTVEAWVKPTKYNDLSAVVQKWGDNTNRRQYLLCFVGAKVRMYISGAGNSWPSAESTSSINPGDWAHIAGTYDKKAIKVYINGKFEAQTVNNEGLFASDVPAWIGGYGPDQDFGSNRHFPGIIDEARYWNGALEEAEIKKAMNTSTANLLAVDPKFKLANRWGAIKKFD
ncbi:TPA: LamG domain-containing protein [bacterium]|nr:LamG domain-containing protein [bacterium]